MKSLLTIAIIAFIFGQAVGQDIAKSQKGSVTQYINKTVVTIRYSRPVARGRELYGGIVPYGKIWDPGADSATTISVSTAIKVNGKELKAGTYSLWAEPNAKQWIFIFSTVHPIFHTRYPGESKDALRLTVTPRAGAHMETMNYYFPVVEGKKAEMVLHWGKVVVPFELEAP
jgi:hypothetical protein